MQKNDLDSLLQEIYQWNPKLKNKEADLIKLIKSMLSVRPETQFDEIFAADLKKDLLSHRILLDDEVEKGNLLFNLKNMNKKIYVFWGTLAAVCLLIVIAVPNLLISKKINKQLSLRQDFTKATPGAFGSLLAATGNKAVAVLAPEDSRMMLNPVSSLSKDVSEISAGGSGLASPMSARVDSKMIAPMANYKYVYRGDDLGDLEGVGVVYRRIKGDGNLSSNLDSLIGSQTFGPINLGSFSNLQSTNISLSENKKLGLSINIDFREENIYIGENWSYWQSDRDKCGDNQACWDSYRLKISDIPEDSNLIAMADKFLSDKGINLEHYAPALVDNNWRTDYEKSQDRNNYYIPEYASVIYPLVVNGQKVYDQSGNLDGLRVTINLLQKAVSGVNNLKSFRYESSDYALETSAKTILDLAENGAYSYYSDNQNTLTIELGTPVKSLTTFWRYTNNLNDELLVPALIFPVLNSPEGYFGPKFISVPLAKEMVDELVKQKNNIIAPTPYEGVSPAASAGGGDLNMMLR